MHKVGGAEGLGRIGWSKGVKGLPTVPMGLFVEPIRPSVRPSILPNKAAHSSVRSSVHLSLSRASSQLCTSCCALLKLDNGSLSAPAAACDPKVLWAAPCAIEERCSLSLLPLRRSDPDAEEDDGLPPTVHWEGVALHAPCANLWAKSGKPAPSRA